ncbi:MAG: family 43 glycosylhydrolase [Tannerellaceae bacterium]|jgi:beta-xylosidase|nr:family 43 glycosylhydrolase [Tannerellaceae bacterium]
MKKQVVLLLCCLGFACSSSNNKQADSFANPVIPGDLADPCVIRIDETYYATGTSSEWAPFYPVFTSTDLVNWTQTGHVFDKQPEWTLSSFWAPELYYHNNQVYCYYTARRKTDGVSYIGVATAPTPADVFTDHGLLVEFGTEAIDAFVFEDDGQLYITWKAYGLDQRPVELIGSMLSDDGLRLVGEPFSLMVDNANIGMEGQYLFKKGDYYYILYSAHNCCGPTSDYDVYVARSKRFKGPYEIYEGNPVLHGGGDFMSCGHGTAVTTPDNRMFYLCHAYLPGDGFYMGRQAILQEMFIGDDGWVYFQGGAQATIKHPMPFANTVQHEVPPFEDYFKDSQLRKEWAWNYVSSEVNARIEKEKLLLSGNPGENNLYGTALCLRSLAPRYMFETEVSNKNSSSKGLTVYGDSKNLLAWVFVDNKLVLKTVHDGEVTLWKEMEIEEESVYLRIEVTNGCCCYCYWSRDKTGSAIEPVHTEVINCDGFIRWDRVARPGLIHFGNPDEPAEFSFFRMTTL